MSAFVCSESAPGVVALSGELNIDDAIELKAVLLGHLRANAKLEVDLLNVRGLDTSGVQIMLMLQRAAAESGKKLAWLGYSSAVEEVLSLLNLGDELTAPGAVLWG